MTRTVALTVLPAPPVHLSITLVDQGTNSQAQLLVSGTAGQRQVIEVSSDLLNWVPLATNSSGTNLFQFVEGSARKIRQRFYRAAVLTH
jgi:hypothetical protein